MSKTRYLLAFFVIILAGCASSGYEQFYHPFVDAQTLPDIRLLGQNEEPKVLVSDKLDRDIYILRSKGYFAIGESSFNGGYESIDNAAEQAKKIGATVVLINSKYTNTASTTSTLLVPNSQTTYHSGNIYGSGGYGSYSGTSTTYGTTTVPMTTYQRRYDQVAVYFVQSTKKPRFGVHLSDLSPDARVELGRNTGALIDVVIEDTPAFYSNVMPGDVLVSLDGEQIKNAKHAIELLGHVPESQVSSEFVVVRKGNEKRINVVLRK